MRHLFYFCRSHIGGSENVFTCAMADLHEVACHIQLILPNVNAGIMRAIGISSWYSKMDTYAYHQHETIEICTAHNEGREFRK